MYLRNQFNYQILGSQSSETAILLCMTPCSLVRSDQHIRKTPTASIFRIKAEFLNQLRNSQGRRETFFRRISYHEFTKT
jgi:hypothetical protein